jgi:threonine aldolase
MSFIDLRSDTVTKPSQAMLQAMMSAEVGDDVFGDDPTVIALENKTAALFGMEAALFCASGTMTNQIAIRVHCPPGSEIICDQLSHIYLYEGGGVAVNAGSSMRLLQGDRGRISAEQVLNNINNIEDIHLPITRLVSLENTVNKGGGCCYEIAEIEKIKTVCQQNNLALHLDGARIFNAVVAQGIEPKVYGNLFDSISVCLSKSLGCPIGSMLVGSKDFIKKSRRSRKLMGGGWRQAGILAAAGIFALDNYENQTRIDHEHAQKIVRILEQQSYVKSIMPVTTNIVIFELVEKITAIEFVAKMKALNVGCIPFGKQAVRFVTHLNIDAVALDKLCDVLADFAI